MLTDINAIDVYWTECCRYIPPDTAKGAVAQLFWQS